MRTYCQTSRGFILVVVLLVSTLFLSAAVSFAWFARQEMRRVSSDEFATTSRGLAVMAAKEASGWIAEDSEEYDSRHRPLYSGTMPIRMDYGDFLVSLSISPLDDKIPINGMFLPDGATLKNEYAYPWARAWGNIDPELAPLVLDFMDQDRDIRPGSREDDSFPNRSISDLGELLWMPDMTRLEIYGSSSSELAADRYFTVYGAAGININMAPPEVLAILDPGIGDDVIERLVEFRNQNNIKNADDLSKIAGFSSTSVTRLKNVINYKSEFYLVSINVAKTGEERNFEAVLRRKGDGCAVVNWRE
ncbi:MAG: general secretion pathway protein GspK [Synergistaceae bacterium]|jgi:type II secretory pathway component PulK|nr:general secretion pathway protein GspK [Synergistaceae bacterium]